MIVRDYNEMKPFLPNIEMKGVPTLFDDALEVAQDDLVEKILGTDLEEQLEKRDAEDRKLLVRCQRVIATDAFLRCIPELDVVLTDAGFGVVSNQSFAPASRERIEKLTLSLQAKADDGRDHLVTYLMRTSRYDDWRGTEEFARLSDGLILTLADFRDVAVLNPVTQPSYPVTWSDFLKLNAALNVALTTVVASYISPEYAGELIEKIRDREPLLPSEKKVLHLVKTAVAAVAMGDMVIGTNQAIKAARMMRATPDDFPTFMASATAHELTITNTDTPIFSLL
ncbi:MAG: hypothetical protein IKN05_07240 [Clostridia bacterium]|nr:hypothetical protein [Clostridia bacterium]